MLWANRNGFFYVLDRTNGRFLLGTPFVKVNWASGLDEKGRPIPTPQPPGQPTWPGNQGGTNWYSPSFSPRTGLMYVSAWEGYASIFRKEPAQYVPGRNFAGGGNTPVTPVPGAPGVRIGRATPINNWTDAVGHGTVMAIDPQTGQKKWTFAQFDVTDSGILTTAIGPAVHRRARRVLLRARCAHRRRAVEDEPRRADRQRSDHVRR